MVNALNAVLIVLKAKKCFGMILIDFANSCTACLTPAANGEMNTLSLQILECIHGMMLELAPAMFLDKSWHWWSSHQLGLLTYVHFKDHNLIFDEIHKIEIWLRHSIIQWVTYFLPQVSFDNPWKKNRKRFQEV